MSDYISIKEFATLGGITEQSIYKRISKVDNPIQPFIDRTSKPLKIDRMALKVLYGKEVDNSTTQPSLKVVEKVETQKENVYHKEEIQPKEETSSASYQVIKILQQQLEANQKELEAKNKTIDSLTRQLEANTQLLNQQQQLSLADKKRILELESSFEDRQNEQGSLWNRFCKWWNKDS